MRSDPGLGGDFDGSSRIAPPGRVLADIGAINAGDERGYGLGWSSISAHRTQETTSRMKGRRVSARGTRIREKPVAL